LCILANFRYFVSMKSVATIFLILISFFGTSQIAVQNNVFATCGNTFQSNIQIEYTLGETFTSSLTNFTQTITQGFNQPRRVKLVDPISNPDLNVGLKEQFVNTSVYPNPTNAFLFVRTDLIDYSIDIKDIKGSTIATYSKPTEIIDLENQSPGVYFLSIYSNCCAETYKIIIE